jgi:hypothetical protein
MAGGQNPVLTLQSLWLKSAELLSSAASGDARVVACLQLLQDCAAARAVELLTAEDDDDLFFEEGVHKALFEKDMVRGGSFGGGWAQVEGSLGQDLGGWVLGGGRRHPKAACAACVLALTGCCGLEATTTLPHLPPSHHGSPAPPPSSLFLLLQEWGRIAPPFIDALSAADPSTLGEDKFWPLVLKDSFIAMRDFRFSAPEAHEGAFRRLDLMLQAASMRQLLAQQMLSQVVAMTATGRLASTTGAFPPYRFGEAWEHVPLLGRLLAMPSLPSCIKSPGHRYRPSLLPHPNPHPTPHPNLPLHPPTPTRTRQGSHLPCLQALSSQFHPCPARLLCMPYHSHSRRREASPNSEAIPTTVAPKLMASIMPFGECWIGCTAQRTRSSSEWQRWVCMCLCMGGWGWGWGGGGGG